MRPLEFEVASDANGQAVTLSVHGLETQQDARDFLAALADSEVELAQPIGDTMAAVRQALGQRATVSTWS